MRKPSPPWTPERDAEVARLYREGKSQAEIARIVDTNQPAVSASLKRTGTPTRIGRGGRGQRWTPERDRKVAELYQSGLTVEQVAREVGSSDDRICESLRRSGVKARPRSGPGPRNPAWKGGRKLDGDGYRLIYAPDHPNARQGYVREHRLVVERREGRYLDPKEVVHHIDGDRLNNDPANLEVFPDNATHLAATLKDRVPDWTEDGKERMRASRAAQAERARRRREAGGPPPPGHDPGATS